ncbi:MAG: SpoIID/LytB protein [uncultured bacterium]|nr:MAG: SpoIID/LytB protein [uncultured bacterium]
MHLRYLIIIVLCCSLSLEALAGTKKRSKKNHHAKAKIVAQTIPRDLPKADIPLPDCEQKTKDKIVKKICNHLAQTQKEQEKLAKLNAKAAKKEGKQTAGETNKEEPEMNLSRVHERSEPMVRVMMGRKIHTVPMDEYLAGVIGNEMNARWPLEALKAQAVAARSYALYGMLKAQGNGRSFDMLPTQADQVFRVRESKNPYLQEVVKMTKGEVISKKGRVVQAFYSSTCGGKTRSAVDAGLSKDSPLTKGCTDRYCETAPFRGWYVELTLSEIEKKLKAAGYDVKNLQSVKVKARDKSDYVLTVMVKDDKGYQFIPAWKFRSAIGYMRIKSVLFTIINEDQTVHIHGNGFGHGVGLCQYGAKFMAAKNKNYRQILMKFYPKTTLTKWY